MPLILFALLALLTACAPQPASERSARTLVVPAARMRGFDPVQGGDVATFVAVARIYEGLLKYDYGALPYRLAPALAIALPEISPDGRIYRFTIKPTARFADDPCFVARGGQGRAVTAADVCYSLRRLLDPANRSPGVWTIEARILGAQAWRAAALASGRADYAAPIAGLRCPAPDRIEIELVAPDPQFPWVLALPYTAVVPREAVDYYGARFSEHPVGTGPFVLESWRRNYRVAYRRNPDWNRDARYETWGGRAAALPYLDRLVEWVIDDGATRWLAFLRGDLALFPDIGADEWDQVATAEGALRPELAARGIALTSHTGLDTFYIGFNQDDPVVGRKPALRQALAHAFDRETWRAYYRGRVVPARGPLPPGVAGYRDAPPYYPYDLKRARALLAEAGYPDGYDPATGRRLELTLAVGDTQADIRESTELLCSFFERLGIVVRAEYFPRPVFFRRLERREAQMFRLSWYGDYPDPENFLQLFYSPNASPGPNRVNLADPGYDEAFTAFRRLPPGPERAAQAAALEDRVMAAAPWLPLHHSRRVSLYHAAVQNLHATDFPYGIEQYLAIEERTDP
ncbi:MAG: hypothetical protein K9N49_02310 [Candidatus Marinimicrobia bacterium]|nr:hypothetical protein [Candidatus Neomarinimicrobiota bacterium]